MANLRHSRWLRPLAVGVALATTVTLSAVNATADAPIAGDTTWEIPSLDQRTGTLRESLLEIGGGQTAVDNQVRAFEAQIANQDVDVLNGFVDSVAMFSQPVKQLVDLAASDLLAAAASLDPSESGYTNIESLPKPISASLRTWLARSLVQNRFYDEALPVVAEVDVADSGTATNSTSEYVDVLPVSLPIGIEIRRRIARSNVLAKMIDVVSR